ncbi:16S rRNA (guanine(966)-N(2))-methyltransferase RsmD [Umezakia ovalisporum]|jgi:16S rRNA (guanine(966)-N(2))-methyltransferase RsmD|uniref:16S rRNA (Guanine(966)-N(2))-methyltransferase RsmD n=2 Tax=Umezakia ovalisporum TaxID=75695 RepID=A0AA43GWC4_9CYAN|nr:16S rRNA (guanine(966)-N(2))-methyltransferase RsmD [Umezakia ovalisporum]MDH6055321.1 16S rRNA (guanine(966)-N(2))-methyltransferase RsmD [Umezakia ovalisporum FSS-43]MDH6062626.1 16S rRNA (guanine(966)-N(2))-methyltransferase RsmD [Umezakia ovalisporum FSS-62]MDH6066414.1 16S rRNA (guanine(966)-N(2))-methyltransferase RsmD [Umezakia ovalisporum APH033B]MDH6071256.1 16S rRNA (guanine(966)-N(2))-methyltransferase RsmD [Umezakia ovalisporum CobakiLakeA]MDH6073740.1 16S rRNA (guanine(966)-N(2
MTLRIYGNRQIKTLPGQDTRPTSARVREAVFNIWQGTILNCRWLDVCTGSGSMGAEALCRGACLVVGIEKSKRACAIIEQNWQQVANSEQKWQVLRGDVTQQLKNLSGQEFDRIYFDPPYASGLYQPVLEAIAHHNLLAVNGEIAVEHHPEGWIAPVIPHWEICREKVYGNTALTFFDFSPGWNPL